MRLHAIGARRTRRWATGTDIPTRRCTDCGGSSHRTSGLYSIFARENHVFSPTLLNEFQASVNRSPEPSGSLSDNTNWADKLGLPNPFGATGWPTIYTSDWWFLYWGGWDAGQSLKDQKLTQFQLEDNVTWVKGKHTVQFGFRGTPGSTTTFARCSRRRAATPSRSDWTALYDPTSQSARSLFRSSGSPRLELGLPTYLSNQYNRGYFYFRQKELGTLRSGQSGR